VGVDGRQVVQETGNGGVVGDPHQFEVLDGEMKSLNLGFQIRNPEP
jgi:hypothetical protein